MQTITRKGSFDAMHRVMNEKFKCFNIHGHTYLYELSFGFGNVEQIGYAIDFKEIKRVMCQWIDDHLDHAAILNPYDDELIRVARKLKSKFWIMSLNGKKDHNGKGYCNPTVENIAKEVFLAMQKMSTIVPGLFIQSVRIYETPNCFTDCTNVSVNQSERENFYAMNGDSISAYMKEKGVINYSDL
jgi:6-pyruvoyltetrahydropterin/6-carboxytetrahydropterin synthase